MKSITSEKFNFDQESNFVEINLSGEIKETDIFSTFEEVVNSKQYKLGMARIWDLRRADLSSMDLGMLKELSSISLPYQNGISNVKVAVVSSKGINMTLLEMFKIVSRDFRKIVETFHSIQNAKDWVAG
jgi:hypothetical protein